MRNVFGAPSMVMIAETSTFIPIQRVKPMASSDANSDTVGWPFTSSPYT